MSKIQTFADALEKELRASKNPAKDPNFRGMRDAWIGMQSRLKQKISDTQADTIILSQLKEGIAMHSGKSGVDAKYVKPEFLKGYERALEIWNTIK